MSEGPAGRAATSAGLLRSEASGAGALTVSRLAELPDQPAPGGVPGGHYVIAIAVGSSFDQVLVRLDDPDGDALYWRSPQGWRKLAGTTRDPATGVLSFVVTAGTTPSLEDLDELHLALGSTPATRLAGTDRVATGVVVSQEAFPVPGSASAAVLARDDIYADALTGGPLAAAVSAPLLLSNRARLLPAVADELRRAVAPGGTVYLLGGTQALSEEVARDVAGLGFTVVRVAGPDRFATAVRVAGVLGDPEDVFLASGLDFPDAMTAGPAAIRMGGALLLTAGSARADATASYLADRGGARYAVGGPAALAHPDAVRIVGADRYSTATSVAAAFFPEVQGVGVAVGTDFPDAIVAAPYLGRSREPLLLAPADPALPAAVTGYLTPRSHHIARLTVFGGTTTLPDQSLRALVRALP